jgi:hypothetical protein
MSGQLTAVAKTIRSRAIYKFWVVIGLGTEKAEKKVKLVEKAADRLEWLADLRTEEDRQNGYNEEDYRDALRTIIRKKVRAQRIRQIFFFC